MNSEIGEYINTTAKVTLPLGVSGATALGFSLQEWVFIVTIIYTVLQIGLSVAKVIRMRKEKKTNDE